MELYNHEAGVYQDCILSEMDKRMSELIRLKLRANKLRRMNYDSSAESIEHDLMPSHAHALGAVLNIAQDCDMIDCNQRMTLAAQLTLEVN